MFITKNKIIQTKKISTEFICREFCAVCPLFSGGSRKINKNIEMNYPWVTVKGTQIKLSTASYRILCALLAANGSILSREKLLEYAWSDSKKAVANNVNVAISELRLILKVSGIEIITERKAGYFLVIKKEA